MASSDEALALLRSIDASLKQLLRQSASTVAPLVADDRDLDGKYGDPVVKFMPRDWTGDSYKGRVFSECPPELLDMLAETLDYFARKADENDERTDRGKKVSDFKRLDAARARGWAKRKREGRGRPEPVAAGGMDSEWPDADGFS